MPKFLRHKFLKKQLGYLAENNPLYEEMYVKEFLLFVAKIHQLNNPQDAVDDVIGKVGLTPEKGKKIGQKVRTNLEQ